MIVRIVLALLLVPGAAFAQTKWDMPTPYSDGEFHTRNVKQFVEDVKKNTGGALDITVHSNQSLIKHADILRAVEDHLDGEEAMEALREAEELGFIPWEQVKAAEID